METRDWSLVGVGVLAGVLLALMVARMFTATTASPDLAPGQLSEAVSRIGSAMYESTRQEGGPTYLLSADGTTLWVIDKTYRTATVWRMESGGLRRLDEPRNLDAK